MSIAKFIHFSDTHLGIDLKERSKPKLMNHRSIDFQNVFEEVIKRAYQDDIDFVIHTGDVFDRSKPNQFIRDKSLRTLFDLSKIKPVLIIPGNHDRSLVDIKLFSNFGSFYVFNRPETKKLNINDLEINITGIPFFRRAQNTFSRYLRKSGFKETTNFSILMLHSLIENSRHGIHNFRFTAKNPEVIRYNQLPNANYVALGHVHRYQQLPKNVFYSGSTERTSFIEREEIKGFLIGFIKKAKNNFKLNVEFNQLLSRPMKQLEIRFTTKKEIENEISTNLENISPETLINCRVLFEEHNPQKYLYIVQNNLKNTFNLTHLNIYAKKIHKSQ